MDANKLELANLVARLEELSKLATPRPWRKQAIGGQSDPRFMVVGAESDFQVIAVSAQGNDENNIRFIVETMAALPHLIAATKEYLEDNLHGV